MNQSQPRISLGGQVVESSLASAGFDTRTPGVSLVETASPARRYSAILLQSAWNALPYADFSRMIAPYPGAMRRRAYARRVVARLNLRRAGRVVCLTEAVAELLHESTGIEAEVAAVTVPIHDWIDPVPINVRTLGIAVVPGTVTWYKRPSEALRWLSSTGIDIKLVKFCGKDDGSGCWQDLDRVARELGITIERTVMPHHELYKLYASADVTILPSALESLGFGLSEALLHSNRVIASGIPPHREVAARTGIAPEWLTSDVDPPFAIESRSRRISFDEARLEWQRAGSALGLVVRS